VFHSYSAWHSSNQCTCANCPKSLINENNQLVKQYNELLSQWKVDRGLVQVLEAEKVEYEKYLQSIQRSMVGIFLLQKYSLLIITG
jgi:16S rRNA G527 N7-methylase RsmG